MASANWLGLSPEQARELAKTLLDRAEELDGITVDAGPWWCNVRPSNTEPLLRLNLEAGDYSRIFILSHMRAFTSLAGHILGSHPQINGYFEMHISYDDATALDKQLEVLQESETLKQNSQFIVDKLLHNDYQLKPAPSISTRSASCSR